MKVRADLHIHSHFSDGIYSPTKLVRLAEEKGLGGLALTDHDTVEGNTEFMDALSSSEIVGIPGVEVSTEYQEQEIHVLGYFVPLGESKIETRLKAIRESREKRFPKMVQKLRDIGIEIDQRQVDKILQGVESPGRPHLARILIENGVVGDINEAFREYLVPGKPGYVKRELIEIIEAIKLLRASGAVPVLAHPLLINNVDLRSFLIVLKSQGLEGVEVDYGYRRQELLEGIGTVRSYAVELELVPTGGSDSHGDNGHYELGSVGAPVETIEKLRTIAQGICEI